jgi:acid phosphatase type 7
LDLALSGHVHDYLRSWPLKEGKRVDSPAEGTIYLVSVSIMGPPKMETIPEYAEVAKLDGQASCVAFTISGRNLVMNAYTVDGAVYDTFTIEKQ